MSSQIQQQVRDYMSTHDVDQPTMLCLSMQHGSASDAAAASSSSRRGPGESLTSWLPDDDRLGPRLDSFPDSDELEAMIAASVDYNGRCYQCGEQVIDWRSS